MKYGEIPPMNRSNTTNVSFAGHLIILVGLDELKQPFVFMFGRVSKS